MNKTDDQLISQFMKANKHEIADKGFSRRVVHRLPIRAKVWSDMLTLVGIVLSIVLFVANDGLQLLINYVSGFFQHTATTLTDNNIYSPTWLLALAVLIYFGIQRVCDIKE